MALFKVPRIKTEQRLQIALEVGEMVYDSDNGIYYGGDGQTLGGTSLGAGAEPRYEEIKLTQENVDSKCVTLSDIPFNPLKVSLTPSGGPPQVNGLDFEIKNGNLLSWSNKGLHSFLEVDDILFVHY